MGANNIIKGAFDQKRPALEHAVVANNRVTGRIVRLLHVPANQFHLSPGDDDRDDDARRSRVRRDDDESCQCPLDEGYDAKLHYNTGYSYDTLEVESVEVGDDEMVERKRCYLCPQIVVWLHALAPNGADCAVVAASLDLGTCCVPDNDFPLWKATPLSDLTGLLCKLNWH